MTFSSFQPGSAKLRPRHPRRSHSQRLGQDSETPSVFVRRHTWPAWLAACTCSSRCIRCESDDRRSSKRKHERHKLAISSDVQASFGENNAENSRACPPTGWRVDEEANSTRVWTAATCAATSQHEVLLSTSLSWRCSVCQGIPRFPTPFLSLPSHLEK